MYSLQVGLFVEKACYLSPNYREGTGWLVDILERMKIGKADFAEIDMLEVKISLRNSPYSKFRNLLNKLKDTLFALWVMLLPGPFKVSNLQIE